MLSDIYQGPDFARHANWQNTDLTLAQGNYLSQSDKRQ